MVIINNNLRILKFFVDNKDKTFSIRKVSEVLNINYRIVYEEIMSLQNERLIKIEKKGNSNICSFNYKYNNKTVNVEELRKEELFKNKDIKLVYNRIKEVKSPFYCLILFGSCASKTNKKGSDIDLCLITDNQEISKEIQPILSITPLDIQLQDFNSKHFIQMIKSKELNVGNEIVKNNIILYGLESFYEMVNNVK